MASSLFQNRHLKYMLYLFFVTVAENCTSKETCADYKVVNIYGIQLLIHFNIINVKKVIIMAFKLFDRIYG